MSTGLQGDDLKYPAIDKQAFVAFKVVKHIFPHLLRSHTKVIVPHTMFIALLIQKEPKDLRGNWLTTLQEYDLEKRHLISLMPSLLVKLALTMSSYYVNVVLKAYSTLDFFINKVLVQ